MAVGIVGASHMDTERAIQFAKKLYADNYRHWCSPMGWCREAALLLLRAFGDEAKAYHYDTAFVEHVVVVYRDLVFDLTRAQFGKGVKRIIGADVSILEGLYGQPKCINQDSYPDLDCPR